MAIFGDFFASCISRESRAARFRPACVVILWCGLSANFRCRSVIYTVSTPCVEVWQSSILQRLRLGEEQKRRQKEEETTGQKYNGLPYSIGRP